MLLKQKLPLYQDLEGFPGFQRVERQLARKCWALGIPVRQDAGRGPVLLRPPEEAATKPDRAAFDRACLDSEDWIKGHYAGFTEALRCRCTYLAPFGTMALHFAFADKSNPFVKYGTLREAIPEIQAWARRWILRPVPCQDLRMACFELTERVPSPPGLFAPGP